MAEHINPNTIPGVSVIICCYNSAKRIEKTLEHIKNQKTEDRIRFELIIVNNASTDDTATVCKQYLDQTDLDYSIVYEPTPGLSAARKTGVSTAKYDYILFCDDDNYLCDTYIMHGAALLNAHTDVYILGGVGEPVFEGPEPEWFSAYALNFACGWVPGAQNTPFCHVNEVYGAGMFVKKQFFEQLEQIHFQSSLSDRKGNSLMSGGDTEYCILARELGFALAVDARLRFGHLMPAGRMNLPYLKKLHFGFGRSRLYTQAYAQIFSGRAPVAAGLKLPLWKDKLRHKERERRRFYPRIWFTALNDKNLDYLLPYEALCGEIEELKTLREKYVTLLSDLKELKSRIEEFKNGA